MKPVDWFITLWEKAGKWEYRIESGPERKVRGQGGAVGPVTREFVREVVWGEYRRLVRRKERAVD